MDESGASRELDVLKTAIGGDEAGLARLLDDYRARLRRMVDLRMDPRLRGRVDASDVIQEAYIDVSKQLEQFVADPRIPFFLWVRFITGRKLGDFHQKHLAAQKRDVRREVAMQARVPDATSAYLAGALADSGLSPSQVVSGKEQRVLLERVLDSMGPNDREILALRHYEQLGNLEAAQVLEITENAANLRYIRALRRLKEAFEKHE